MDEDLLFVCVSCGKGFTDYEEFCNHVASHTEQEGTEASTVEVKQESNELEATVSRSESEECNLSPKEENHCTKPTNSLSEAASKTFDIRDVEQTCNEILEIAAARKSECISAGTYKADFITQSERQTLQEASKLILLSKLHGDKKLDNTFPVRQSRPCTLGKETKYENTYLHSQHTRNTERHTRPCRGNSKSQSCAYNDLGQSMNTLHVYPKKESRLKFNPMIHSSKVTNIEYKPHDLSSSTGIALMPKEEHYNSPRNVTWPAGAPKHKGECLHSRVLSNSNCYSFSGSPEIIHPIHCPKSLRNTELQHFHLPHSNSMESTEVKNSSHTPKSSPQVSPTVTSWPHHRALPCISDVRSLSYLPESSKAGDKAHRPEENVFSDMHLQLVGSTTETKEKPCNHSATTELEDLDHKHCTTIPKNCITVKEVETSMDNPSKSKTRHHPVLEYDYPHSNAANQQWHNTQTKKPKLEMSSPHTYTYYPPPPFHIPYHGTSHYMTGFHQHKPGYYPVYPFPSGSVRGSETIISGHDEVVSPLGTPIAKLRESCNCAQCFRRTHRRISGVPPKIPMSFPRHEHGTGQQEPSQKHVQPGEYCAVPCLRQRQKSNPAEGINPMPLCSVGSKHTNHLSERCHLKEPSIVKKYDVTCEPEGFTNQSTSFYEIRSIKMEDDTPKDRCCGKVTEERKTDFLHLVSKKQVSSCETDSSAAGVDFSSVHVKKEHPDDTEAPCQVYRSCEEQFRKTPSKYIVCGGGAGVTSKQSRCGSADWSTLPSTERITSLSSNTHLSGKEIQVGNNILKTQPDYQAETNHLPVTSSEKITKISTAEKEKKSTFNLDLDPHNSGVQTDLESLSKEKVPLICYDTITNTNGASWESLMCNEEKVPLSPKGSTPLIEHLRRQPRKEHGVHLQTYIHMSKGLDAPVDLEKSEGVSGEKIQPVCTSEPGGSALTTGLKSVLSQGNRSVLPSGEKLPYECDICSLPFPTYEEMFIHRRQHNTETNDPHLSHRKLPRALCPRYIVCKFCEKSFQTSSDYGNHVAYECSRNKKLEEDVAKDIPDTKGLKKTETSNAQGSDESLIGKVVPTSAYLKDITKSYSSEEKMVSVVQPMATPPTSSIPGSLSMETNASVNNENESNEISRPNQPIMKSHTIDNAAQFSGVKAPEGHKMMNNLQVTKDHVCMAPLASLASEHHGMTGVNAVGNPISASNFLVGNSLIQGQLIVTSQGTFLISANNVPHNKRTILPPARSGYRPLLPKNVIQLNIHDGSDLVAAASRSEIQVIAENGTGEDKASSSNCPKSLKWKCSGSDDVHVPANGKSQNRPECHDLVCLKCRTSFWDNASYTEHIKQCTGSKRYNFRRRKTSYREFYESDDNLSD